MFNFKNLEALLDVKWKTLFKDAAPKDKEAISYIIWYYIIHGITYYINNKWNGFI